MGYVKQRGVSLTYSAPLLLDFYSLRSWGYSLRLLLDSEQSAGEVKAVVFGFDFKFGVIGA